MKAASTKDVQLKIHNLRTFVKSDNERVHGLLYGKLALFDKSAVYSPAYKVTWDGMVRFYYKATQSFNTGLLSWAYKILKNEGFKVSFIDCRKPPDSCVDDEIPLQITLRDYQQDIVDQCVKCTRGIINAATGSGKTECFIALIAKLRVPTIVILDNVDLILQTSARIEACGIPVNRIMGGRFPKSDKWVHVGTYQTLRKQKKELAKHKFGLKVADECHGVAAGTWFDVMNAIPTYYSFGFSGTVDWRMEDPVRYARIMSMTGKQLVHVSSEYLVSIGILAKPNINMLYYDCKMPKTDYPTEYDIVIVKSKMLNERIVPTIVKKHENAKILILVNRIEHGKYLSDLLNYSFVSGSDSASTREKMLDDFKKGIITKLIASKIFKQGIDIPDVEVIITLGSDDSYKAVFQKLGRGLRKADGKNELHYYDVFPRSGGYAERHAKNRRKKYEYAGFDVNIIKDYTK